MGLKRINLKNFRSYSERKFVFSGGVNVVYGNNAKGKTNLLEAIYLVSVGESFKARRTEEMISFGEEVGSVAIEVEYGGDVQDVMVMINGGVVMGKKVNKRKYMINYISCPDN